MTPNPFGRWVTAARGYPAQTSFFDEVGNITYFNGQTYTWNANRQLEAVTTEDGQLYRYYYNENGFLTRLDTYDSTGTVCEGSMSYLWNGDVLVARVLSDYESGETIVSKVIYDSEGEAVGTAIMQKTNEGIFTTQVLLYRKNLQGDITGLIDSVSGQLVAAYTYDAYGMLVAHPINDNQFSVIGSVLILMALPQAYRGYVFSFVGDELCYYLGSRFYSPRLGRFINADKHFDTETGVLGTNMYAYCNNNPVMNIDPTGETGQRVEEQHQPLGLPSSILAIYCLICVILLGFQTQKVSVQPIEIDIADNSSLKTKTLSDVKAEKPTGRVYQLAYVNDKGELVKLYKKYSFVEALKLLGFTSAKNTIAQKFTYNRGYSSEAQRTAEKYSSDWGFYTPQQSNAKALATVCGATTKPEVHGSGKYGHYHDETHTFHIWYGGRISY